ncbi:MAG TPA: hypothetical protein VGB19_14540 [Actinomycetota bacterium]
MRRRTFDFLVSTGGLVMAVVLFIAGALLFAGYSFANNNVTTQLTAQKIFFPEKGSDSLASPEIGPYLNQYAGQQMVNGAQAEAYANHFIAVHLSEVAGGKTYAEVSGELFADPTNKDLIAAKDTLFRGETLRGMLLNAYAFWKVGQIAKLASIAAFALGGLMLLLSLLGLWHLRKVSPVAEVLAPPVELKATA